MRLILIALLLASGLPMGASAPAPAQLLPPETLLLLSVPDADKAVSAWTSSAYGKLWQDPALRAFKERLSQRWTDDFAAPLERDLGLRLADYLELIHGQITVAVIQGAWGSRPDAAPAVVLLVDTKDKEELLKTRLSEIRKHWIDSGKHLRSEKIRDLEFTTLILRQDELKKILDKALPAPAGGKDPDGVDEKPDAAAKGDKTEITFGQSGSMLLVSNSAKELERILARQAGSLGAALADQGCGTEANHSALFRDALAFAWINFARAYDTFAKQLAQGPKSSPETEPLAARPDKILSVIGLGGVKTVAARFSQSSEGASAEVVVSIPSSRRQGLFRVLGTERREAGPPPFVGADVIKFKRWRKDGQKVWSTAESLLTSISPELGGLLQMGFEAAGKDRDPNFDLRKALVGNLGNDFITLRKGPRSSNLSDLNSPPSLFLIGSAHPEQLVQGIKAGTALMPLAGAAPELKEREFLGRRIYSMALPPGPADDDIKGAPSHDFSFASGGGYAALSADPATLEAFLRGSEETSSMALRDLPGLNEAAEKVGGMSTGFFGYENQAETMRIWLDSAKKESAALDGLLSLAPLAGGKTVSAEDRKNMKEWMDVSLLPAFDRISKYFSFLVYSISSNDEGFNWKLFAPTPPRLR